MPNRWSNITPQSAHRPWQWRHIGGKFWREWRRLRLCRVGWKLTYEIGQHTGLWGTHQKTGNDARGLRGRDWHHRPTNRDFLPYRRAQNSGACRQQDQTARNTPRKICHASGWHPDIIATLTPGKHLGHLHHVPASRLEAPLYNHAHETSWISAS